MQSALRKFEDEGWRPCGRPAVTHSLASFMPSESMVSKSLVISSNHRRRKRASSSNVIDMFGIATLFEPVASIPDRSALEVVRDRAARVPVTQRVGALADPPDEEGIDLPEIATMNSPDGLRWLDEE